ncbi:MAG: extracellular solute-binding protein [Sphingobacteriia bacterium]|nr:extracellular solute-binding protein [Sphingobacteriia bacterium]
MKALAVLFIIFLPVVASANSKLNVYNWSNYIDQKTVQDFEKIYKIDVNYDLYDSDYTLDAKLYVGKTGYDIVVPTAFPFLARQSKIGMYKELDTSKLKNYKNLNPAILEILKKNGGLDKYGVPWMVGTLGIGYNTKVINKIFPNQKIDSWKYVFNKEYIKKISACGVVFIDAPNEIIPAALLYLGLNPNSQKKEDLLAARKLLLEIRPYIHTFDSSKYIDDLANEDICLAVGFSGDLIQAKDRAEENGKGKIKYIIPKEGTQISVDTISILKDAKNVDEAYKFIDYLLRPDVASFNTNRLGYANANSAADKYIHKSILNNKNIYLTKGQINQMYILKPLSNEIERMRSRLWIEVLTSK